jgi:hypothetical protein
MGGHKNENDAIYYDIRYKNMSSDYSIGLEKVYEQNGILRHLDKNGVDFFERENPQMNFWIRRNYKWMPFCNDENLTRKVALDLFDNVM